jgi:hypothetical protein
VAQYFVGNKMASFSSFLQRELPLPTHV